MTISAIAQGAAPAALRTLRDEVAATKDHVSWAKVADATAATATAETPFYRATEAHTLSAFYIVPGANVTANDTDYATITIKKRPASDYTTPATVATLITNVAGGSWVAFTPKSLGTLTNAAMAAGDVLTATIAKAGSGVSIPISVIEGSIVPA